MINHARRANQIKVKNKACISQITFLSYVKMWHESGIRNQVQPNSLNIENPERTEILNSSVTNLSTVECTWYKYSKMELSSNLQRHASIYTFWYCLSFLLSLFRASACSSVSECSALSRKQRSVGPLLPSSVGASNLIWLSLVCLRTLSGIVHDFPQGQ